MPNSMVLTTRALRHGELTDKQPNPPSNPKPLEPEPPNGNLNPNLTYAPLHELWEVYKDQHHDHTLCPKDKQTRSLHS